ncbi:MAG: hypothetical protein KGK30_10135, partial [Elusimicrobia bacterium]|nr:hypothetical protein [Elusimicrobiota bacterium]
KAILAKDERGLAGWIPALYAEGIEPAQLLRDLRSACEVLYLQALGLETTADPGLRLLEGSAEQFSFLLRRLDKALGELRFGDSPRLTLELGLFDCLGSAADLGAWVKRLEELERRLGPDSPKASRGEGEGKAVPPASRPAADVAHPQGGEEPDGAAAQAWQSAIAALREEKAALAATLEQARLAVVRGAWTVTFARPFDRDSAERGRALIEAKLASTWGKSVHLEFFVGQNGHRPADELVDPVVTSSPAAQAGTWKDAAEASPAVEPPAGFSKAQHVLGGKVRIVKKPAP